MCDAQAVADRVTAEWDAEQAWFAERERERAEQQPPWPPARRACPPERRSSDELHAALLDVPADLWLPALTSVDVPRSRTVCCPLPGHDDRTPSCRIYDTSFYCFGCHRGGDIFNFASELYGIQAHSREFPELRERLAADLLGARA